MRSNLLPLGSSGAFTKGPQLLAGKNSSLATGIASLKVRTDNLGRHLADLYDIRGNSSGNTPEMVKERVKRTDECWDIYTRGMKLLGRLQDRPNNPVTNRYRRSLREICFKALRYNRESPVFLENGPVAIVPISFTRNFLRDGTERMYFLALHGLPSAYDFFCGTFTETPRDYRQVLHLHRFSEELDLILDGNCDCVWYQQTGKKGKARYVESGRVKAERFQAVRIPPGVVHTLHNPDSSNANITIKLSMFIDDRFDVKALGFDALPKSSKKATIDGGELISMRWGERRSYRHRFKSIGFNYRLDVIKPGKVMPVCPFKDRYFLLFKGRVKLSSPIMQQTFVAGASNILRIAKGLNAGMLNSGKDDAVVFSLEGLDYKDFCADPGKFPEYSSRFLKDLRMTMTGGRK